MIIKLDMYDEVDKLSEIKHQTFNPYWYIKKGFISNLLYNIQTHEFCHGPFITSYFPNCKRKTCILNVLF